jgi:hypothetical protein
MSVRIRFLVLAAMTALLTSCSVSPSANITGNWQFQVSSGSQYASLSGSLISSGSSVTGVLHSDGSYLSGCLSEAPEIAVSGTLDSSNTLTLSAPLPSGSLRLTGVVTPSAGTISGSMTLSGGSCTKTAIPMTAALIPNISGNFTGTVSLLVPGQTGQAAQVTANLLQSNSPTTDGFFPLSGTVTATSPTCNLTFSFSNGLVSGIQVQSYPFGSNFGDVPSGTAYFQATASSTSTALGMQLTLAAPCGTGNFGGSLSRQ